MFEKEAEEYANNWKINKNSNLNFAELLDLRAVIYQAHKDGAEYGYNKALEEATHNYNAIIADYDKRIAELEEENAELKEKIRLTNEQEAMDIRTRFPCYGVTMFEKEAEEYRKAKSECKAKITKVIEAWSAREETIHDVSFKDGAEFGYNKANEWHYVKDGDLPKDDIKLAIIEIDDCGYLLCNYRNGFWYDANPGATCAEWITNNIIAWKEIVPPKED